MIVTCPNCGGTLDIAQLPSDATWQFASTAAFVAAGGPTAGGWALMTASQRPTGTNTATLPSPAIAVPNGQGGTVVCHVPPCPGSVAGGGAGG